MGVRPVVKWSSVVVGSGGRRWLVMGSKWGEVMEVDDGNDDLFARKRLCIRTNQADNILESFKIIVKGKVFRIRAKELFVWSPSFSEVHEASHFSDDESVKGEAEKVFVSSKSKAVEDDTDSEVVSDTFFGDNEDDKECINDDVHPSIAKEVSNDPFKIYDLLNKRAKDEGKSDNDTSIPFPPGFTPVLNSQVPEAPHFQDAEVIQSHNKSEGCNSHIFEGVVNSNINCSPKDCVKRHSGKEGGSILGVLDEMIKVGQAMGFAMDGCARDMENIIGSQGENETKMEKISDMEIKFLWGNYNFDYSISEALGNSGGILCVWDPSIFHKDHHIISDNFIALYGTWIPMKSQLLMISVYAPQSPNSKRLLWNYISSLINRWNGESMVMGDFNEVRCPEERWGSVFSSQGARSFNSFISTSGLNDIQLEGYSFTWAHPSGFKMSKLDRFLVSDGVLSISPHLSAICLDKHLSDHRPILLREFVSDYGPIPFRIYHSWFSLDGFDQMVKSSWNSFNLTEGNGMSRFKKKLQMLKGVIRSWVAERCYSSKVSIQDTRIWDYLDDVLLSFGFGIKWRSWIRGSLVSSKAAQEGDPLAPFLFILIMESLHLSFSRAIDAGLFTGIKLDSSLSISHLFYADDVVFIGEWSNGNLSGILNILKCFSLLSGLSINLNKSQLLGVGVSDNRVFEAALTLGCSVMKYPFKYLGVRVGDNMSLVNAWDETVTKLRKRLTRWKLKTLSIGGRLTLLKSVLGSSPIYNMSLFKAPKSVINKMEGIRRDFFNGIQEGHRKISWTKWSKVLAAKKFGGLGVSSFFALNRALLAKWFWRYLTNDGSLWCRVISSIHGGHNQIMSAAQPSLWGSIIKEMNSLKVQGVDIVSHFRIRVGNGSKTRFWKDIWIGDSQLQHMFPRLFALESAKDSYVAEKLDTGISASFRRTVRGGAESYQLDLLLNLLEPISLSSLDDRWVCDLNGDGEFRVKDIRLMIDEFFLPKGDAPTRWINCIPIKVNIFAWKMFLDRLPTRSNLARRNVVLSSVLCPICDVYPEDMNHLFFKCSMTRDITRLVCRWWDLGESSFSSYGEWLSFFKSIRLTSKLKIILEGVFYTMCFAIKNFSWDCTLRAEEVVVPNVGAKPWREKSPRRTTPWLAPRVWETDGESVLRETCPTRASFHDLLLLSSFIVYSICLLLLPYSVKPPNAQAVQDVETWKHSDFLCHNYVLNGLVGSLYNVYYKTTTAKELWESLECKHKTEDAGSALELVKKETSYVYGRCFEAFRNLICHNYALYGRNDIKTKAMRESDLRKLEDQLHNDEVNVQNQRQRDDNDL
ncbi:RNA-directed DNA polymerase, eukaryota [Tanacetum coccineum]